MNAFIIEDVVNNSLTQTYISIVRNNISFDRFDLNEKTTECYPHCKAIDIYHYVN
jgi:hypothetical protein